MSGGNPGTSSAGTVDGVLPRPVCLASSEEQLADYIPMLEAVGHSAGDVPRLLELAGEAGGSWPVPGQGQTVRLWELLASVAAVDVAAARVFEPHLDALAILQQAGGAAPPRKGGWGVFAAERPGMRLRAAPQGGSILLSGSKPWCSLAPLLSHAVVTAFTDDGGRAAFAVDLRHEGLEFEDPGWVARGLREIPSGNVHFDRVPALPVGGSGWYHNRPGFAWGGMGVAACWLGGAAGVAREYRQGLLDAAASGREPDQLALAGLGEVDRLLTSSLQYLSRAAARVDEAGTGGTERPSGWSEAQRVRGTVAAAVERILQVVSSNRGPAPLAFDETYAKRVADLALYVRQHHGQRDDAQLGALALKGDCPW
jgi:alkylation response protein AidB-like acyl-CoA dehydrogenase